MMTFSRSLVRPLAAALLLAGALAPAGAQITPAVERWSPAGPQGGTITALAVAPGSSRTLYAGTDHGLVFRSTDGGGSWSLTQDLLNEYAPEAPVAALTVDPRDPAVVYAAVCYELIEPPFRFGGVFKSTNGGRKWTQLDNGLFDCRVMDLALDLQDPDTLFAAADGGLYKTEDGGASWDYSGAWSYLRAVKIDPSTPGTLYVIDLDIGVQKSTDGGATWAPRNAGLPLDAYLISLEIDPHTPGTLYVNTYRTTGPGVAPVYRSVDGGETWTPAALGLDGRRVADIVAGEAGLPATVLYAATEDGVFRSQDGGQSWTAPPAQTAARGVLVLAPASPSSLIYAGARYTGMFKSTDSGTLWRAVNSGLNGLQIDHFAVAPSTPSVLYATVRGLSVHRSDDGGATWRPANGGLPPAIFYDRDTFFRIMADPRDPRTAFAGRRGGLWKTSDGGASWRLTTDERAACSYFIDLAFDPRNNRTLYTAGYSYECAQLPRSCSGFKSTNAGESWTCMIDLGGDPSTLVIDPVNPAVLHAGGLFQVQKTVDAGLNWTDTGQGLPNPAWVNGLALPHTSGTVLAGTVHGLFQRTGNASWAAAGLYRLSQTVP
jgi:photosystem II stability/assembly factor-like uncharacterized protein